MIQRIQSVFLFLASCAAVGPFTLPFAEGSGPVAGSALLADERYVAQDHIGLMLAFGLGALVSLLAIFLYKNRPLQMKLALLGGLLAVVGAVLAGVLFVTDGGAKGAEGVSFGVGLAAPVAALILNLLAHRSIKRDEKLVRSMDRLR